VLRKCANPACLVPFRNLNQGKLFLVETEGSSGLEERAVRRRGQSRRVEYYWLCDQCAFALTLSYQKERGVVVVPRLEVEKKKPAMAAHPPELQDYERRRRGESA
jgi:hypothetical protein